MDLNDPAMIENVRRENKINKGRTQNVTPMAALGEKMELEVYKGHENR